jgi:phage shock protein PspC (stress-responsive transcriptional regulator)
MQTTAHSQPQLLRRNTRDGRIAGVAAGLGDYFRVDPVFVRLLFILLVVAGGFGLLVYLIAWLVIPASEGTEEIAPTLQRRLPLTRWSIRSLLGGLLLVVGAIAFLGKAGSWWLPEIDAWPIILLALGAGLLLLRARRDDSDPTSEIPAEPSPTDDASASEQPSPEDADSAGSDDARPEPMTDADTEADANAKPGADPGVGVDVAETGTDLDLVDTRTDLDEPEEGGRHPHAALLTYEREPASTRADARRRVPIGWLTLGALALAGALAAFLDWFDVVDLSTRDLALIALAICGVALLATTLLGRKLAILGLAVVAAAALLVGSLPDSVSVASGAGERTVRPASIAELEERYELGAGKLTIDLRQLDNTSGETLIEAELGVGELIVLLPWGAAGEVQGHANMGEVELFGRADSGVSVSRTVSIVGEPDTRGSGSGEPFPYAGPTPFVSESRIVVDATVGIGKVEARRGATHEASEATAR